MPDIDSFAQKIRQRMTLDRKELTQKQQEINDQMTRVLERQQTFEDKARNIVANVVCPRLEELSHHFKNAGILPLDPEQDLHAVCEFSHTSRFPAKVTLNIVVSPAEAFSMIDVHFDLNIFPMLLEYQRTEAKTFTLDAADEIGKWIEDKLLSFLELYLQLQVHPLYQKDNLVTDPVCNMSFPVDEAAGKIEWQGRTLYFCSKICQASFSKAHNIA